MNNDQCVIFKNAPCCRKKSPHVYVSIETHEELKKLSEQTNLHISELADQLLQFALARVSVKTKFCFLE